MFPNEAYLIHLPLRLNKRETNPERVVSRIMLFD